MNQFEEENNYQLPQPTDMKKRSSIIPRLEDQEIIAVDGEVDLQDVKSGNESVIL